MYEAATDYQGRLMHHSLSHLLDDLFPQLRRPRYQRPLEIVSFLLVTMMLVGALLGALFLLYER